MHLNNFQSIIRGSLQFTSLSLSLCLRRLLTSFTSRLLIHLHPNASNRILSSLSGSPLFSRDPEFARALCAADNLVVFGVL